MDYNVSQQNNKVVVHLNGQFVFTDNQKFRQILELANQDNVRAVELNFAHVDFIDSAGLGMLLLLRDQCQARNVNVAITGATGQVERIFVISKFDQLFSIHS